MDTDATIGKARASGFPEAAGPRIREIYDGGELEITSDVLAMRVAGFPEAVSRNYKIVGEADGCYRLEVTGAPGVHAYCIESDRLVVQDPDAKIMIVYRRG